MVHQQKLPRDDLREKLSLERIRAEILTQQTFQPFWERNVKIVKRKIETYLHSIGSEARLTSTHPAPPASSDRKRREARLREKEEEQTTRNGRSGEKKRRRRRAGGSVQRR